MKILLFIMFLSLNVYSQDSLDAELQLTNKKIFIQNELDQNIKQNDYRKVVSISGTKNELDELKLYFLENGYVVSIRDDKIYVQMDQTRAKNARYKKILIPLFLFTGILTFVVGGLYLSFKKR